MQSNFLYALLHLDVDDETKFLDVSYQGKSLAQALVALKHHPCTRGHLYAYTESFDQSKAKLIASKFYDKITRHDVDEKQRKTISFCQT